MGKDELWPMSTDRDAILRELQDSNTKLHQTNLELQTQLEVARSNMVPGLFSKIVDAICKVEEP